MNDFLRRLLALPEQASTFAKDVDMLHFVIIAVTMAGAAVVAFFALYFVVRYRRKSERLTERVTAPVLVEVVWIGSLLGFFLAIWIVGYRLYIHLSLPPRDAMEVYVTGKQWMWHFAYPDGRADISVLTVPVNVPVKLNMTSRDVIHSFAVPSFRIKKDVLPNRYTSAWFQANAPGTYEILCAELCGVGHSTMWGSVVVLSAADYEAWERGAEPAAVARARRLTTAQRPSGIAYAESPLERGAIEGQATSMAELGRSVAVRHACFGCHTLDGRTHIGPSFRDLYGAQRVLQDGTVVTADAEYLTESMMDPRAKVVSGFAPVMPSYQGLLSAAEAGALVELIRAVQGGEGAEGGFPGRVLDATLGPEKAPGE